MTYLVDTNFLLRFADRANVQNPLVRSVVKKLKQNKDDLKIFPQNCTEFWNVITRPVANNGFGFSITRANHSLRLIERIFPLLPDDRAIYPEWRKLIVNFGVMGVQVHDARLAAAMIVHKVTHILTFNASDFTRYNSIGIVAVDPTSV